MDGPIGCGGCGWNGRLGLKVVSPVVAIVGRCPLDKRVGCEALPVDQLVSRKGGIGTREMNVPYGTPVEWRVSRRGKVLLRSRDETIWWLVDTDKGE